MLPLFFVWESGFSEAILNNKDELLQDPAFRELVKKVSEWVLSKTTLSGVFGFRGLMVLRSLTLTGFARNMTVGLHKTRPRPTLLVSISAIWLRLGRSTKAAALDEDQLAQEIEQSLDGDPAFKDALEQAYNASVPPGDVVTKGVGNGQAAKVLLLSEAALNDMFPGAGVANTRGVFTWWGSPSLSPSWSLR